MITIQNLSKRYGNNTVLKDISIQLDAGKIYGLVGANGCGKTTLMRCICGFSQPTTGYVVVNDCLIGNKAALKRNPDLKKAANPPYKTMADFSPSTGVIIESPGFLPNETGLRNLMLLADMSGKVDKATARRAMVTLGLGPDEKKPVGKYSLGMRQRLGIAQAIMEDPRFLILDEPFNGLDKHGVAEIRELLLDLKAAGKTILLASHNDEDIRILCDHVYEMDGGVLRERTA